jgi:hypothetical protein
LSLFSKGLPANLDLAAARGKASGRVGREPQPFEESIAFGRAIAASSRGEVLHFNLGMEDQWG